MLAKRFSVTPLLLLTLTGVIPAQVNSDPAPSLPYVTQKICPFEYCVYRDWIALQDVPVYDTWSEPRHQIGSVLKGETVTAQGGVVVTYRPGTIHVERDVPEAGLRRGDNVLTYAYHGEGYSQVWFNGHFHDEFDITFTKWPDGTGCGNGHCAATYFDLGKKAWLAQLKLKSGAMVWADMMWSDSGWADLNSSLFLGVSLAGDLSLPTMPR